MDIKLGNVVAVKGCKVEECRQTRKLSAAHLTYVLVNPPFNGDIDKPEPAQEDSPTKKATKARSTQRLTSTSITDAIERMRVSARDYGHAEPIFCTFSGKVQPFEFDDFSTMPLYGSDSAPKIRYEALLCDESGILPKATIWNDAARELLHCNGAAVLAQWENVKRSPSVTHFWNFLIRAVTSSTISNAKSL